jgi:hypothetical protein
MLRPVLAWRAFWNVWTVYISKFQIFFRASGTTDTESGDTGAHLCVCVCVYVRVRACLKIIPCRFYTIKEVPKGGRLIAGKGTFFHIRQLMYIVNAALIMHIRCHSREILQYVISDHYLKPVEKKGERSSHNCRQLIIVMLTCRYRPTYSRGHGLPNDTETYFPKLIVIFPVTPSSTKNSPTAASFAGRLTVCCCALRVALSVLWMRH